MSTNVAINGDIDQERHDLHLPGVRQDFSLRLPTVPTVPQSTLLHLLFRKILFTMYTCVLVACKMKIKAAIANSPLCGSKVVR